MFIIQLVSLLNTFSPFKIGELSSFKKFKHIVWELSKKIPTSTASPLEVLIECTSVLLHKSLIFKHQSWALSIKFSTLSQNSHTSVKLVVYYQWLRSSPKHQLFYISLIMQYMYFPGRSIHWSIDRSVSASFPSLS